MADSEMKEVPPSEEFSIPPDTDNLVNGQDKPSGEYSPLHVAETAEQKQGLQEGLKVIVVTSIVFAISVTVALILTIYLAPPPVKPHGAVSCAIKACSDIGLKMLQEGSGMDAAVATTLCAGLVEPHHSGLGGGGFISVRKHAKNESAVFDFRETAPGDATADMYANDASKAKTGVTSVAVPGELRGLYLAHSLHGSLAWEDVLAPVIKLANDGFAVTKSLHDAIKEHIPANSPLANTFYDGGGQPLQVGDILRRPELAQLLQNVSDFGPDAFYTGPVAEEIVGTVQSGGGTLKAKDLVGYACNQNQPLIGNFLDNRVEVPPSPSGGPILLLLLNILQEYPLSPVNASQELYYHRLIEAISFAYAQDGNLGDLNARFGVDAAVNQNIIISEEFAAAIKEAINDNQTQESALYASDVSLNSFRPGTAGITIYSPAEEMISIQTSLRSPFGSKVMTPSGVILNNAMADFTTGTNSIAGGKRPLSSLIPAIVHTLGKPCGNRMAIAGTNGSNVVSGVAEVITKVVAFGQTLEEAIESPRIHRHLSPDIVEYDRDFPAEILQYLTSKGHKSIVADLQGVNTVNAVQKINETLHAHADTRIGSKDQASLF